MISQNKSSVQLERIAEMDKETFWAELKKVVKCGYMPTGEGHTEKDKLTFRKIIPS